MVFSVEWLVETIAEERPVVDRVNTALQQALGTAGIVIPFPTQNVHLQVEANTIRPLSQAFEDCRPDPIEQ